LENFEFEKSKTFIVGELLEYVAHSIVIKTILRKTTGNISAISCDAGEVLPGRISPFDNFIQVIDGTAEIITGSISTILETGQSIIIPAHSRNIIRANVRFKILSTIIKSGYEEII
jgi:quercetin dioxygenase-like cupin family protein